VDVTGRRLGAVGLLALVTVLQVTLAPRAAVLGIKPDLLLLTVVGCALTRGSVAGCLVGAAAGTVEDVMVGQYLGVRALALALVGLLTARAATRFFGDQPLVPVVAALGGTALAELTTWVLWRVVGLPLPLGTGLARVVLPSCLYNGLVAVLFPGWWVRRARGGSGVGVGA
jgi:rod shape-determining protein MreD